MKHDNNNQNPWAGLSSYEDPAKSELKLKFCGRDNETKEVARLIDDNFFVTLYGKSGIGKTSLLNAGVFPALRREQYTPLSLRLGMTEETISFQDVITQAIEHTLKVTGGSVHVINVIDEQREHDATDYLWRWFARRRFLTANGQITFPVLVFDQFEEVFRHKESRKKTKVLLEQLNYLIDEGHAFADCIVDGEDYNYDFNFRFVLSIREDDLYRLEDALDNCALSALKHCRYRLRSLSEQGARDAILIPGEGLFREDEKEQIVQTVIGIARNKEDNSISTNLLSLVSNRLYVESQKTGSTSISMPLVDSFVKGNPFERFYNEVTRGLSNKEKEYIENEFVIENTCRRNSVDEEVFLNKVKNGTSLFKGDSKILQRTSTSSDGGRYRVELIHDSFCEPLNERKKKRKLQKKRLLTTLSILVAFLIVMVLLFVNELRHERDNIKICQSRFLAEKVMQLIQNDDACTGTLLALKALEISYTAEAEAALRESADFHYFTLKGHSNIVKSVEFSFDGNYIVTASDDKTIKIWNTQSFKCENTLLGHDGQVEHASYNSDGSLIISASRDGTARLWNAQSGVCIDTLGVSLYWCMDAVFSKDDKLIATAYENGEIRIWNTNSRECIDTLIGHSGGVHYVVFSHNGKLIASSSEDGTIRLWKVSDGVCLDTLITSTYWPTTARTVTFSNDDKMLLYTPDYNTRIWNIEKKICNDSLNKSHSAFYSNDGTRIISTDYGIKVWDATSLKLLKESYNNLTKSVSQAHLSPQNELIVWTNGISSNAYVCFYNDLSRSNLLLSDNESEYPFFSNDGKKVKLIKCDGSFKTWDFQEKVFSNKTDHKCYHRGYIKAVCPNGEKYAYYSMNDSIYICFNDAFRAISSVPKIKDYSVNINKLTFSNSGDLIVSAAKDGTIGIWNCSNPNQSQGYIKAHNDWVLSVAISPDGRQLASASRDKTIKIWNVEDKHLITTIRGHKNSVTDISYSPDGKNLVSSCGDGEIKIWDVKTGKCDNTLYGHNDCVKSVSYSNDGKLIISAASDGTVRVWDVKTCVCIYVLNIENIPKHDKYIDKAGFSPDGRKIYIYSCSTLMIFDFPPLQQLIDETLERFKNRKLTPEEQRKYYLE